MATQYGYDIRHHVIDAIGYRWDYDYDGTNESVVSITNEYNDTVYIPMFLPFEWRVGELPYLPAIEVTLVNAPARMSNISGDIYYNTIFFDFNLYYVNNSSTGSMFGNLVVNKLCNLIFDNRTSVTSSYNIEVIDSSREFFEPSGNETIFHRIVSCKGYNYN